MPLKSMSAELRLLLDLWETNVNRHIAVFQERRAHVVEDNQDASRSQLAGLVQGLEIAIREMRNILNRTYSD